MNEAIPHLSDIMLDIGNEEDTERAHAARVAESQRKLAELERDRPLWAEAQARREKEETARQLKEEAARQARAARARDNGGAKLKEGSGIRNSAPGKDQKEQQEDDEKTSAIWSLYQAEVKQMKMKAKSWTRWTVLRYYIQLAKEFDVKAKNVRPEAPLTWYSIPWPILANPYSCTTNDITWKSVEAFLSTAQKEMDEEQFNSMVISTQRRFHDDRWRNRHLYDSIPDKVLRASIEEAVKSVSQAVSAWRSK